MGNELNTEILKTIGDRAFRIFPHTIGQKLDPKYRPYNYLIETSRGLVSIIVKGNGRAILCWHPRGGKTTLLTYVIIWHLELWPEKSIIFASYSEDFARARVRLIRNTILQNQKHLSIRLAPDSQRVDEFYTIKGGCVLSVGIGSGLMGRQAHLLAVDDIYGSWADSQNPKTRLKVTDWFTGTAYSRLEPNASVIVCGGRWHVSDLQGFLLDSHSDNWISFSFPALSVGQDKDPFNRPENEPLCPERFDKIALENIRDSIGPKIWMSQYQQNPTQDKMEDNEKIVFPENLISQIENSHLPAFEDTLFPYAPQAINYLAVDFGKKRSHTGVILCQVVDSEDKDPDKSELHITFLKQYPLKTLLRLIVKDLDKLSLNKTFGGLCPVILVDASGSGAEYALEEMHKRGMKPIIPLVVLSTGKSKSSFRVPKEQLIENLVDFISEGRLRISPNLSGSDILFSELRGYRSRVSPKGRTITYKPYSQGTDDLVDCVVLCAWATVKRWQPMWAQQVKGLYEHSPVTRRPLSRNRMESDSNLSRSLYALNNPGYAEIRGWR